MSGGSLNYAYHKVEDIADMVERQAKTALHKAFAKHLRNISTALHDLEWVLSYDYSEGSEIEALEKVVPKEIFLQSSIEEAQEAVQKVQDILSEIKVDTK